MVVFGVWASARTRSLAEAVPPKFNRDIAPIAFRECAPCHRPGESAPFSLLTFEDFKRRGPQIVEVLETRLMPPWLPEPSVPPLVGERRLEDAEIASVRDWVKAGMPEGLAEDLPAPPTPPAVGGWVLGVPDLVVTLPKAYTLASEGRDVYRNFVVPIPGGVRRFVRGVEFHPGNARAVHHAFVNIDETPYSRRLAARADPPAFEGMVLPDTARMPGGQLLGWQPGKRPMFVPEGLPWVLNPGSDLVLQLHLNPSGKPETVQPSVGFYFTDTPPTQQAVRLNLSQLFIDLPAGATNTVVERSYTLPVAVRLHGICPHAHYLGRDLQGFAVLPDGSRLSLLRILDWDFNWQGDYRYATPLELPKGTRLEMRFSYDNSDRNVRNPHHPPKRVGYGLQSTDEMAELWFQVVPLNPADREVLLQDFQGQLSQWSLDYNLHLIRLDPSNAVARTKVGRVFHVRGQVKAAYEQLREAVRVGPDHDKGHYELGFLFLLQNRLDLAKPEFETVVRLNPDDYEAEGCLGTIYMRQGNLTEARKHLERALEINPGDAVARANLNRLPGRPAVP
jgi:Flp pilus assembly protein TadD